MLMLSEMSDVTVGLLLREYFMFDAVLNQKSLLVLQDIVPILINLRSVGCKYMPY